MKSQRIVLTVLEVFLVLTFFYIWFMQRNYQSTYSAMLLLPIIVAIAFSEKSYFSKLFRLNLFRYLNKISLAIYLNQWAAWKVVSMRFGGHSYKFCLAMMAVLTLAFSVAYFIILKIIKLLWEKKLKEVFCCSK